MLYVLYLYFKYTDNKPPRELIARKKSVGMTTSNANSTQQLDQGVDFIASTVTLYSMYQVHVTLHRHNAVLTLLIPVN